jgi:hypothetical protein
VLFSDKKSLTCSTPLRALSAPFTGSEALLQSVVIDVGVMNLVTF